MGIDSSVHVPVYIPWDTFTGFVGHLKATAVPGRIDKSMMPADMPALTRGQILSALKFLKLVDDNGAANQRLRTLVSAYETDKWADTVGETVPPAYLDIIGDLNIDEATQAQLDERFKAAGVNGQMMSKSVRFYLAAMKAAGWNFSPHLLAKRKNGTPPKKKAATKPTSKPKVGGSPGEQTPIGGGKPEVPKNDPPGTVRYPLYFKGKPEGAIVVPADLEDADCKVIELQLAVLRAYVGSGT